jgi:hypothetical protein
MALILYLIDRVLAACTGSFSLKFTGEASKNEPCYNTHWQAWSQRQILQKISAALMIVVITTMDLCHRCNWLLSFGGESGQGCIQCLSARRSSRKVIHLNCFRRTPLPENFFPSIWLPRCCRFWNFHDCAVRSNILPFKFTLARPDGNGLAQLDQLNFHNAIV